VAPQQPERPELTPAQERAVRDLLAGARHSEPVPDDVASRLDATLAELVAELVAGRDGGTADGTDGTDEADGADAAGAAVVPLAARRRRRRRIGASVLAAAAVVVGGVTLTEVLPRMASEDSASSGVAGGHAGVERGGPADREATAEDLPAARSGVPHLGQETFRRDVLRARGLVAPTAAAPQSEMFSGPDGGTDGKDGKDATGSRAGSEGALRHRRSQVRSFADACDVTPGPGRAIVVRYAGRRALLVLRPARDDRQVADLYRCGATEPLRSVELAAR